MINALRPELGGDHLLIT